MSDSYLLLEDGSKLLLEGTGALLLELVGVAATPHGGFAGLSFWIPPGGYDTPKKRVREEQYHDPKIYYPEPPNPEAAPDPAVPVIIAGQPPERVEPKRKTSASRFRKKHPARKKVAPVASKESAPIRVRKSKAVQVVAPQPDIPEEDMDAILALLQLV